MLSVIIPTRDRAKTLALTLASIERQTLPKEQYEVIVVDNGSTDDTARVCAEAAGKIPNFTRIYDPRPGLHVGRNAGLENAKGDLLVYGDDDIEAFPEWLQALRDGFSDARVGIIGGKNLPLFEIGVPEWLECLWSPCGSEVRVCTALSILDLGEKQHLIDPCYVFGCNFAVRRRLVLEAGGFHPDGLPDSMVRFRGDGESHVAKFAKASGMLTLYDPKASVYHHVPASRMAIEYFCSRAFREGISESYADARLGGRLLQWKKELVWLRASIEELFTVSPSRAARIASAKRRGYRYHRAEYRRDRTLRDWVHRENYLGSNGNLPI